MAIIKNVTAQPYKSVELFPKQIVWIEGVKKAVKTKILQNSIK